MKRGSAAELRHCLGQGASLSEEAVLAGSGGRVRSTDFLSILQGCSPLLPDTQAIEVLL